GTAGTGAAGQAGSLAGLPVHVVLGGWGWRALIIAAAALVVAAGAAIVVRGGRLPVMSGRYDRQAGSAVAAVVRRPDRPRQAATMWGALSAGGDPAGCPGRDKQQRNQPPSVHNHGPKGGGDRPKPARG